MVEEEMRETQPKFRSEKTELGRPERCGDGRAYSESELGVQMFGGSVFPVVMDSVYNNVPLDEQLVKKDFGLLKNEGIGLGVHRDTHAHGEGSGCGFADQLIQIIQTLKYKEPLIREIALNIYSENADKFKELSKEQMNSAMNEAFGRVQAYNINNIKLKGGALISACEKYGASTEMFTTKHTEEIVHYNLVPGTTFNTIEADKEGENGFNVDAWAIDPNAKVVGINDLDFSLGFGLIASIATEIVLVENSGHDRLPVSVNS